MSLPDEVTRDLTLAHSENCLCHAELGVGKACREVREIIAVSVERAILLARADEMSKACLMGGLGRVHRMNELTAQAAALKGES